MRKYRVDLCLTLTRQVVIEADSKEDAEEKAQALMRDMGINEFDDGWGEHDDRYTGSIIPIEDEMR